MLVTPLYALGSVELAVLGTLLVPIGPLNSCGLALCGYAKTPYGLVVCGTIAIFLLAFVVAGMFDVSRLPASDESLLSGGRSCNSQLGALLAGADLVCGITLLKLSAVMKTLEKLNMSHGALKKQAENIQVEYKRLLDTGSVSGDEATAKLQSKVVDLEERLSGLDKKNAMLAISNDTLAAEKKAAEATSEALKKQAVGVSKEYERMLAENEELREQIQQLENDGKTEGKDA